MSPWMGSWLHRPELVTALELTALGEELLRQRLRREQPDLSDEEIEAAVARWWDDRPGAPRGDAVGRPRDLRLS